MSAKSRFTDVEKQNIRDMYYAGYSKGEVAERYGISESYVTSICYGYEGTDGICVRKREQKIQGAITPEMIREIRSRIHIGDIVICLDAVEECNGRQAGKVKNRCEVTGVYPSVFTVKRPFWTESFTYIDLIRQNGVMMEWLQSEVEE